MVPDEMCHLQEKFSDDISDFMQALDTPTDKCIHFNIHTLDKYWTK